MKKVWWKVWWISIGSLALQLAIVIPLCFVLPKISERKEVNYSFDDEERLNKNILWNSDFFHGQLNANYNILKGARRLFIQDQAKEAKYNNIDEHPHIISRTEYIKIRSLNSIKYIKDYYESEISLIKNEQVLEWVNNQLEKLKIFKESIDPIKHFDVLYKLLEEKIGNLNKDVYNLQNLILPY